MKEVLVVGPTVWDREELASAHLAERYRFRFLDDGACDSPGPPGIRGFLRRFDVRRTIDRTVARFRGRGIDGVVGTDDYLACALSSAVAQGLGLPGTPPESVLRCQHKYWCREIQGRVVPEATPRYSLLDPLRSDPEPPDSGFPIFVKPVRGTSSILARRIESHEELRRFLDFSLLERLAGLGALRSFNQLLERYGDYSLNANYFLAEEVLSGSLVTVEGWVLDGGVEIVAVVDSTLYPGTDCFERFDYPSRLDPSVQRRMGEIVRTLVPRLGLDRTLFNVEMFHRPDTDEIRLVEVNPRMSYQFADLYEKVDGFNTYEVLLALAVGDRPRIRRGVGPYRAASSFVLRRFEDARVLHMPDGRETAEIERVLPGARVRLYGKRGKRLSDLQKGVASYRYGIVNLGGKDRGDLAERFDVAERLLGFRFDSPVQARAVNPSRSFSGDQATNR